MKTRMLFLLLICLAWTAVVAETQIRVEYLSREEMAEALSKIGRLELVDNTLLVKDIDGILLAESNFDDVIKITFVPGMPMVYGVTTSQKQTTETTLRVYPNPTMDVLYLDGVPEGETIRVYTQDGQLVYSGDRTIVNSSTHIPVAALPNGVYLLQINTQVVKFIKQ